MGFGIQTVSFKVVIFYSLKNGFRPRKFVCLDAPFVSHFIDTIQDPGGGASLKWAGSIQISNPLIL